MELGEDPEEIKAEMGGTGHDDVYSDPKTGDVFVGPKDGQGIGQPAYIRLKPDGSVEIAPPIVRGGVDDLPLPSGEVPLE